MQLSGCSLLFFRDDVPRSDVGPGTVQQRQLLSDGQRCREKVRLRIVHEFHLFIPPLSV